MKKWALLLVLAIVSTWVIPPAQVCAARPSYLVLRVPARQEKHRTYYPARGYAVKATPYAYGWFGVRPKRHWTRSTGYYGNYLQWSSR